MIINFEFSNFRSFRDKCVFSMETVDCDAKNDNYFFSDDGIRLLNSAIIYGANASGKTNLIRSVYNLSSLVNNEYNTQGGESMKRLYDPYYLSENKQSEPTKISITFITKGCKYKYDICYNRLMIIEEVLFAFFDDKLELLFKRKSDEINSSYFVPEYGEIILPNDQAIFKTFSNKTLLSKFLNDSPQSLITPAAQYIANINIINSASLPYYYDFDDVIIDWLKKNNNKQKLTQFMRVADFGLRGFFIDDNNKIFTEHDLYSVDGELSNNPARFSYRNESYGTIQMLFLGFNIFKSLETGLPLFIDEMDNGLHTYMSDFVISLFKNKKINRHNAQLVITTHDTNLMNENKMRRDQIWFTNKSQEGASELYSLADFEEVHEDTHFEEWYLNNMFGATPKINMNDCEKIFYL